MPGGPGWVTDCPRVMFAADVHGMSWSGHDIAAVTMSTSPSKRVSSCASEQSPSHVDSSGSPAPDLSGHRLVRLTVIMRTGCLPESRWGAGGCGFAGISAGRDGCHMLGCAAGGGSVNGQA